MSTLAIHHGLLGFVRLLATAMAAGWVSSPMSWSPDARWLTYTVAPDPAPAARAPGWIFDTSREEPGNRDGRAQQSGSATAGTYRIWASQRDGESSVLIEESAWPLTAPAWNPRGRSLAYGRFVPESIDPHRPAPSGRFEIVIQDGLDHKRTLLALPGFELDRGARDRFPHAGPAWSPDGQYLAVPRPGSVPALLIVRVDARKVVRTLDRALLPAWSPDGSKLAFLRIDDVSGHSLQVMERHGQTFIGDRTILPIGRVAAPVAWGDDGRSILALMEKSGARFPDLDLARIAPETSESMRIFSLAPEVLRHGALIRGVAIDFDRNDDLCFFSIDFEGRDTQVMWTIPGDRLPYKPLLPLDQSLRVGSLSIAPDGHAVAMRFGTPGGLSLPAVVDLTTERTTLIVPDESARRAWLGLLVRTSRSLLAVALPQAIADGKPVGRPTLLPLPDEVPLDHPLRARLAKLGRFGSAMYATRRGGESRDAEPDQETETDPEDRLFFDYLRGDFTAAAAGLDALEPRITTRAHRLALLSLRAQVLWGGGETTRARDVAGYLLEAVGGPVHRLEETPLGRSLVPEPGPGRPWARYLATRASQPSSPANPPAESPPIDRDDPMFLHPFAPPDPPAIEFQRDRFRPGPAAFAPHPPGDPLELIRARARARFFRFEGEGARKPNEPPPPPRPIDVRPRALSRPR